MKTPWLIGIVIGAHCVAVGSVMLIQGCGTLETTSSQPPEPIMPGEVQEEAVPTVRPLPPAPPPAAKVWPTDTTTYVVGRGDCLSGIAKRFNVSMAEIMALNGLKNPDFLRLGQKLTLPGKQDVRKARVPRRRPAAAVVEGGTAYVVKSGDTLSHIARRYKITVRALRDANRLRGDRILVGQKLAIPGARQSAPPKREPAKAPEADLDMTPVPVDEAPVPVVAPVPVIPTDAYQVEEGDSLRSIAMKNAVSVSELRKLNNLPEDSEVQAGQTLRIPSSE